MLNSPQDLAPTISPPIVRFERRGIEDRTKTLAEGKYMYTDVDFALIRPNPDSDEVERTVDGWFGQLREQAQQSRVPRTWIAHFENMYSLWKASEEVPADGTALRIWPGASPAEVMNCLFFGLKTVEVLADQGDTILPPEFKNLIDRAKFYLKAAKGSKLASELAAANEALARSELRIASLESRIQHLESGLPPVVVKQFDAGTPSRDEIQ